MTDHLALPFHGDDIDIYRVRTSGFVLTAYRYTPDGKDEENYSADAVVDLMEPCVKHLVENHTESADWQLGIAVYGAEQVPADFIDRIRALVDGEVGRWRDALAAADIAKAKAKEDRERAEYDRLRARFGCTS
jgi:hypothetical protein